MSKAVRFLSLMLCALLAVAVWTSGARAEVTALRVVLSGRVTAGDGSVQEIPLEGSFRVLQNGQEAGTVTAGGSALLLPDYERIRLEPLAETFAPGWNLREAYITPNLTAGGEAVVEVVLSPASAAQAPAETPAPADQASTDEPQNPAEQITPEAQQEQVITPAPAAQEPRNAVVTPTLQPYEPTPAPTAVPSPEPITAGENAGSLRIWIFNDKNDNGKLGLSEPGIPGITVWLLAESGEAVASTVTDEEGEAYFERLPAGTYCTRVFLPSGWNFTHFGGKDDLEANAYQFSVEESQTSDPLAISAGRETLQGIGIRTALYVSGFCFLDESSDGLFNSGEAMIPGVRITLEREKDHLYYETVSGEDGSWIMDRVRPGQYTLTAYAPEGMMFAKYTSSRGIRSLLTRDGVTKASASINLNDNNSKSGQYIGFTWAGRIYGRCYQDANYNGLYDEGEQPLAGVKVAIARQISPDEEFATAYSDADGFFVLNGLRGNTYRLRAVMPEDGSTFTAVNTGDPLGNRFVSRPDRRENFWNDFVLSDAEQREIAIGGIYPATVKGTVYMDNDFSASLSGKEKIVSGFLVTLRDASGNIAAQDKTSIKGVYELTGLVPGEYTLSVSAVKGYAFTRLGEGNVIRNLNGGEGVSDAFRVELGETVTGKDIGMILPGTVEGDVFADRNDNGLRDAGEEGLSGVTVRLMSAEGETPEEAFSAEIDTEGHFLFDAVMPGQYYLEYVLPEGAVFARTAAGGNTISGGENRTGRGETFSFATGDLRQAPLCGALTLGRISGSVFRDHDGDGIPAENGAEEALAGATVQLIPSRAELETRTAETGEDGGFALEDLRPDTYTLRVLCPDGFVISRTDALKLPLSAGLADQSVSFPVTMGRTVEKQRIGAVQPAALRGRLWLDENNNGLFDEREQTPAGYPVTVTDDATGRVFDTPVTDENGYYAAAGMIPGRFTLSVPLDEITLAPLPGDSLFEAANGILRLSGITLTENEVREDLLVGIIRLTSLSGRAWIDRGNGAEGLAGAEITLADETGNPVQHAVTDGNGMYSFASLMPGTFRLEAAVPEGCVLIEPGDSRLDDSLRTVIAQSVNRVGSSDLIKVRMDQNQTGLDIGCVLPGRLGDTCWADLDGDGLQGAGEPGIASVRIELLRDGITVAETMTDAYGFYRFPDLYPATYTLRVYCPDGGKPTRRRPEIPLISSVLEETEDSVAVSVPLTVESSRDCFDADLGFACRTPGVLPAGAGEAPKMIWSNP
ncbi:MAG: hypothetical protein IKQ45_07705 [Clostridia bacterium]|nr:hypothetical protein [Clostridia bacterium]